MTLLAYAALIGVLVLPSVAADGSPELSAWDLLVQYERLVPLNQALRQGKGFPPAEKLPKHLGTFQSREVEEVYFCGDLCPQNGTVAIRYAGVAEADCSAVGDPLYLIAWGRQYEGCTPWIVRRGRIEKKENSLMLSYEGARNSVGELRLVFHEQSQCGGKTGHAACDEIANGRQVIVKGIRSGDEIAVFGIEF
jgi:hypothetical protein